MLFRASESSSQRNLGMWRKPQPRNLCYCAIKMKTRLTVEMHMQSCHFSDPCGEDLVTNLGSSPRKPKLELVSQNVLCLGWELRDLSIGNFIFSPWDFTVETD
jgi:hypothetical protein